jgi:hypothetical protein
MVELELEFEESGLIFDSKLFSSTVRPWLEAFILTQDVHDLFGASLQVSKYTQDGNQVRLWALLTRLMNKVISTPGETAPALGLDALNKIYQEQQVIESLKPESKFMTLGLSISGRQEEYLKLAAQVTSDSIYP